DGAALARVSGERVRDEFSRLLAQPQAAPWLRRLDALGLLTVILPDLEPLRGLEQPPPHHLPVLAHSLETVHALETLLGAQPSLVPFPLPQLPTARLVILKLAALLHDTGKAAARTVDAEGRIRFIGHAKIGARITAQALRRLYLSRAEVQLGETIVRHHMRPLLLTNQPDVSARAVYRFFRDTGDAGVDILLHALADHRATYLSDAPDDRWPRLTALTERMLRDYYEHRERIAPPLLINGHDLLREFGLQPGPHIGEILETVREAQVSGEVRSREEALALVRRLTAPQGGC
ncbi:MAG TPA: HD domain-containing protein, partial [Anaerolineae bacterium]|nr:HD domain-containing protein [Anaerolineae bacterium]